MDWRYVLDCKNLATGINDYAQIAIKLHYRFMMFNGLIYIVNDDASTTVSGLGIKDMR